MIDRSLWEEDELSIIEFYKGRCIRCPKPFVTLHEIVPRSKLPTSWKREGNRIPVCYNCHEFAHSRGTRNSKEEFIQLRDRYDNQNQSKESKTRLG